MKRVYLSIIKKHFEKNEQMLFLVGPRQIFKRSIHRELLPSKTFFSKVLLPVLRAPKRKKLLSFGKQSNRSIYFINRPRSDFGSLFRSIVCFYLISNDFLVLYAIFSKYDIFKVYKYLELVKNHYLFWIHHNLNKRFFKQLIFVFNCCIYKFVIIIYK